MSPLELILSCFPSSLRFGFLQYIDSDDLEQIHLCRGGQIFIKRFSAGISVLDLICTDADFDHILKMVCAGSVYAHDDTIKNGYISFAETVAEQETVVTEKKAEASYWLSDGVHPTAAGHELIARELVPVLEKELRS